MTTSPRLSRRQWLSITPSVVWPTVSGLRSLAADSASGPTIDNTTGLVDLSDLTGPMPLVVQKTTQVLRQTEDWEHSTWKNPNWPRGGGNTVGYPTVVRNIHGPRPDGKYYLFYAHHDPRSGIGVAVSSHLTGPYSKNVDVPGRKDNQVIPSFHANSTNPDDPSHNSSPWVVWNPTRKLWCLYFHFFNHAHTASTNFQPTALATCSDLASHRWTILPSTIDGLIPRWQPVLPTTKKPWANEASSYNTVHRLVDGRWLAFIRGTSSDGRPTRLGFALSRNGVVFQHLPQNPILHFGDQGGGRKGVYRPAFLGYLGHDENGRHRYLVAWQESHPFDGDPRLIFGETTDFVSITRDPRGHAKWKGDDGAISAWREGDRLFLFSGKHLHQMKLPVKKPS